MTPATEPKKPSFLIGETRETTKRLLVQIDEAGDDREPLIRLLLLVLLKELPSEKRASALEMLDALSLRGDGKHTRTWLQ
jgi:hypothetical protein